MERKTVGDTYEAYATAKQVVIDDVKKYKLHTEKCKEHVLAAIKRAGESAGKLLVALTDELVNEATEMFSVQIREYEQLVDSLELEHHRLGCLMTSANDDTIRMEAASQKIKEARLSLMKPTYREISFMEHWTEMSKCDIGQIFCDAVSQPPSCGDDQKFISRLVPACSGSTSDILLYTDKDTALGDVIPWGANESAVEMSDSLAEELDKYIIDAVNCWRSTCTTQQQLVPAPLPTTPTTQPTAPATQPIDSNMQGLSPPEQPTAPVPQAIAPNQQVSTAPATQPTCPAPPIQVSSSPCKSSEGPPTETLAPPTEASAPTTKALAPTGGAAFESSAPLAQSSNQPAARKLLAGGSSRRRAFGVSLEDVEVIMRSRRNSETQPSDVTSSTSDKRNDSSDLHRPVIVKQEPKDVLASSEPVMKEVTLSFSQLCMSDCKPPLVSTNIKTADSEDNKENSAPADSSTYHNTKSPSSIFGSVCYKTSDKMAPAPVFRPVVVSSPSAKTPSAISRILSGPNPPETVKASMVTSLEGKLLNLRFPIGVCTFNGGLVVCNSGDNTVIFFKYLDDGSIYDLCYIEGDFKRPSAVVVDAEGHLYVKDDRRIRKYNNDLMELPMKADPNLSRPYGLALTRDNQLVTMCDCGVGRGAPKSPSLRIYDTDGNLAGYTFLLLPSHDRSKLRFMDIHDDTIYISDLGASFVYSCHVHSGADVRKVAGPGKRAGSFYEPSGITCDRDGNVIIADSKSNRLQIFDNHGGYRAVLDCEGGLVRPSGIYLSADDTLYVVNYLAHKVHVYRLDKQ